MQLAADERTMVEAPFGLGPFGGTATLTTRRIVIAGAESEQSIPLAALTSVRAGFARKLGGAMWGAILLAFALAFGAGYRPLETAVNTLGAAIEKRMNDKAPEAQAYGRFVYIPTGVVWLLMLPLIGWGGYRLAEGLIGETELVLSTASGDVRRCGRGRRVELLEFGAEVGRAAGR